MKRSFFVVLIGMLLAALGFAGCENPRDVPTFGTQQTAGQQPAPQQGEGGNGQQPGQTQPGHQGQGGQTGTQQTTQAPAPQPQKLSFQLPQGWEWHEETTNKARSNHRSADGAKPFVIFQLYDMGAGQAQDARKNAKDDYQKRLLWCVPAECATTTKYQEMQLSGYDLYVSSVSSDYWGKQSWYSSIFFSKDGHVYAIELDDLPDNERAAVQSAVQTLKNN